MRGLSLNLIAMAGLAWLVSSYLPATLEKPVSGPVAEGWNRIDVPAMPNGQFVVVAQVDGRPVTFLLDSGASGVVLAPQDARRLGLAAGRLAYSQRLRTANGEVRAAPVTLREVRLGPMVQRWLPASVTEAPLPVSLLGMSFLQRLETSQVRRGQLSLYW